MVSRLSVRPTAATASAPSFETQKMSATAKIDSITISRTIGMASSRIARASGIAVRSRRDPASASRTSGQNLGFSTMALQAKRGASRLASSSLRGPVLRMTMRRMPSPAPSASNVGVIWISR